MARGREGVDAARRGAASAAALSRLLAGSWAHFALPAAAPALVLGHTALGWIRPPPPPPPAYQTYFSGAASMLPGERGALWLAVALAALACCVAFVLLPLATARREGGTLGAARIAELRATRELACVCVFNSRASRFGVLICGALFWRRTAVIVRHAATDANPSTPTQTQGPLPFSCQAWRRPLRAAAA